MYPPAAPAYETATALASTEEEKAYLLTALALLEYHRGSIDAAKTLLFKWCAISLFYILPSTLMSHFSS